MRKITTNILIIKIDNKLLATLLSFLTFMLGFVTVGVLKLRHESSAITFGLAIDLLINENLILT